MYDVTVNRLLYQFYCILTRFKIAFPNFQRNIHFIIESTHTQTHTKTSMH